MTTDAERIEELEEALDHARDYIRQLRDDLRRWVIAADHHLPEEERKQ